MNSTNHEQKIHLVLNNNTGESKTTFVKASMNTKYANIPFVKTIEEETWITLRLFHMVSDLYNKGEDIIRNNIKLEYAIYIFSSIFAISHLMFSIYLIAKIDIEENLIVFIMLIPVVLFYLFTNICYLFNRNLDSRECIVCIYTMVMFIYVIPGVIALSALVKVHRTYGVIFGIFNILAILPIGIHSLGCCITFFVFLIVQFSELLYRLIFCKWKSKKKNMSSIDYNTYYYDSKKTDNKICSICLNDFIQEDLVCVFKCYKDHIYHEKCITEWLQQNPVCPMCRTPAELL